VDRKHDVGPGDDQVLVAAFQMGAPETSLAQVGLLQHGAHRAIQDPGRVRGAVPGGPGPFGVDGSSLQGHPVRSAAGGTDVGPLRLGGKPAAI